MWHNESDEPTSPAATVAAAISDATTNTLRIARSTSTPRPAGGVLAEREDVDLPSKENERAPPAAT
jgi:hypothetical protein